MTKQKQREKMTDRKLLELAAKAAGLSISWDCGRARVDGAGFTGHVPNYYYWNPLEDDGAVLRLAVKLNMTIRCYGGNTCAQTTTPGGPSAYVDEMNIADPGAATRRAIVRVAAEIGGAA